MALRAPTLFGISFEVVLVVLGIALVMTGVTLSRRQQTAQAHSFLVGALIGIGIGLELLALTVEVLTP